MLVDGAIIDRIPISVVKDMGADIVIAVDVGYSVLKEKPTTIFEILFQASDIMMREISREKLVIADVLIRPEVGQFSSMDLSNAKEIIQAGVDAARQILPRIRKMTGVR